MTSKHRRSTQGVWTFATASRGLVLLTLGMLLLAAGCGQRRASQESGAAKAAVEQPAQPASPPSNVPESDSTDRSTSATHSTQPTQVSRDGQAPPVRRSASPAPEPELATFYSQKQEDVPLAPMGEVIGPSPLTKSPGYKTINDPEADAVKRGRRIAPKVDIPFTGGVTSPELLAQAILDGLRNDDFNALRALRVTPDEFVDIMWPEFPESRPICNADVNQVYFFLDRTCHSGITLGLSNWGGQNLRLLGVTYAIGKAPYTNFTLYQGVGIHVLKEDGTEGVIKFARTFAERNGIWKVYAYKDKD